MELTTRRHVCPSWRIQWMKKGKKKADYVLRVRFRLLSPLAGFLCTYDYLPSRRYLCLYLDEIATCMLHLRDFHYQIRKNRLKFK